jgi:transposase
LQSTKLAKTSAWKGRSTTTTRADVYGIERTVVLVYNPALLQGQLQGIMNNLGKTQKVLGLLKEKLAAWKGAKRRGRKPTAASVEKQVKRILCREYMKTLISYTVQEVEGQWVDLQYAVDKQAFDELKTTSLGKTILFSDREDWEAEQYILTYRDQYGIEHDFRQMKDPSWVSWDPLLH